MKNIELWKPGKFIISGTKLVPSENIGLSSKRMAQYVSGFYSEYIPKYCSGRLLDLGCGNVPMYDFYKSFVTEVTCVDWGFSLHNKLHLDVECDLNKRIPLGDNLFDTIIMSDVIEHLIDPMLIFREICRMLTPGGNLIINYPFMYSLHEAPFDYCRYTHFYIEYISSKTGLEPLEKVQFGSGLDVIENLVLKNVKRKKGGRYLEKICWIFFNLFNKGKSISIRANNYTATPFGYGFVMTKPIKDPA
jgi:SAM-dependent methyltransferase